MLRHWPGPQADIQPARERQEEIAYAKSDGRETGNICTISPCNKRLLEEWKRYYNRLAELVAAKKGEDYAREYILKSPLPSLGQLRNKLWSALLCLRGSRIAKRTIASNVQEAFNKVPWFIEWFFYHDFFNQNTIYCKV